MQCHSRASRRHVHRQHNKNQDDSAGERELDVEIMVASAAHGKGTREHSNESHPTEIKDSLNTGWIW